MSNTWQASKMIELRKAYPWQWRIKRWRRRCQDGTYSWDEVMRVVKELDGETWNESRRTGHRIFAFRTEAKLLEFRRRFNLQKEE